MDLCVPLPPQPVHGRAEMAVNCVGAGVVSLVAFKRCFLSFDGFPASFVEIIPNVARSCLDFEKTPVLGGLLISVIESFCRGKSDIGGSSKDEVVAVVCIGEVGLFQSFAGAFVIGLLVIVVVSEGDMMKLYNIDRGCTSLGTLSRSAPGTRPFLLFLKNL